MENIFEFKIENSAHKSLELQSQLLASLLKNEGVLEDRKNDFCLEWIEKYSKEFRRLYEENPGITLDEMTKALGLDRNDTN